MIKLKNIKRSFGKNEILKNINLTVNKGDVVTILGASSIEKTTLLKCIDFLGKANEGLITINEHTVDYRQNTKKRVQHFRRKTAIIFQNYNLFENKTALENIMEELTVFYKIPKNRAQEISLSELKKVSMQNKANYYPFELSRVEQQRVAIASALVLDPDIILLDNSTSALDHKCTNEVLLLIKKAVRQGITIIIVTNDISFARNVSNHIVFMDGKEIIEKGTPKDIFFNPKKERTKQFLKSISHEHECVLNL